MLSNWHLRYQLHSHVLQGNRGKTEERGGMHVFEAYESRKMTPFLFFNISNRINTTLNVDDIWIIKASHDFHDRIAFSNMSEALVT